MTAGALSTRERRPIPKTIFGPGSHAGTESMERPRRVSRYPRSSVSLVQDDPYASERKGPILDDIATPTTEAVTMAAMRIPYVSDRLPDGCQAA